MSFLNLFKNKSVTYLLFFIAVIAFAVGLIPGFLWDAAMGTSIAAMFGFGSIASLRTFIDEKGWKTYTFAVGGIIVAVLSALNYIPIDVQTSLIKFFLALSGYGVVDGLVKQKE